MRPLTIWERIKSRLRMKQTAQTLIETGLEYTFKGKEYLFTGNVKPLLAGIHTDSLVYDEDGKEFKADEAKHTANKTSTRS